MMISSLFSPITRLRSNPILRYKYSDKTISTQFSKRLYTRKKNSMEVDYKQDMKKNDTSNRIAKSKSNKFNYKTYRYKGNYHYLIKI